MYEVIIDGLIVGTLEMTREEAKAMEGIDIKVIKIAWQAGYGIKLLTNK